MADLDVQRQKFRNLLCHADVQDGTGVAGVRLAEKVSGIALGQDIAVSPKILLDPQVEPDNIKPMTSGWNLGTENGGAPGPGDFLRTDTVQDRQDLIICKPGKGQFRRTGRYFA